VQRLRQNHVLRCIAGSNRCAAARWPRQRVISAKASRCRRNSAASAWCSRITLVSAPDRRRQYRLRLRGATAAARDARVHELGHRRAGGFGRISQELSAAAAARRLARALAPRRACCCSTSRSPTSMSNAGALSIEVRDILNAKNHRGLVTHEDKHSYRDMVGIMKDGRIEQWDTPYAVSRAADPLSPISSPGPVPAGTVLDNRQNQLELALSADTTRYAAGHGSDVLYGPTMCCTTMQPLQAKVLHRAFRVCIPLYPAIAGWRPGVFAGAQPPQSRHRRKNRHPSRNRPPGAFRATGNPRAAEKSDAGPLSVAPAPRIRAHLAQGRCQFCTTAHSYAAVVAGDDVEIAHTQQ